MKIVFALLMLADFAFAQTLPPPGPLRIELHASSVHVRMNDEIVLRVFFRSPGETTTIWNALWWGANSGLSLHVFDAAGREVPHTVTPIDPIPPDLTGKNALISIGGRVFAGFDSQFTTRKLFPHPGSYKVMCVYRAPLRRDYFTGHRIWGKEDGPIESPRVSILVER